MSAKPKPAETQAVETPSKIDPVPPHPATVVTIDANNKQIKLANGKTVTLAKQINRVLLRHADGQTVMFTVLTPVRDGKEIKGSKMAAAKLVTVTELNTGREMDYIVPAVLLGLWTDEYANNSYVGKSFAVFKEASAEGKRYKNISAAEVTVA